MNVVEPRVLVTGGLGYIGSHAVVALSAAGFQPIIVDNCRNSSESVLDALETLCGTRLRFHRGDVRDAAFLRGVLGGDEPVACCVHFAGLKAVEESVRDPLAYHENNVGGSITLLQALEATGCRRIVFSSSATVYGDPTTVPITETHAVAPVNPYGRSKLAVEQILGDLDSAGGGWSIVALRYFNPAGAHASGLIGERPAGTPNNLMPYVSQVASGQRPALQVFGDQYPTRDGTGERDYLHVVDLAEAHVRAVDFAIGGVGMDTINLGTGRGYTVLEVVEAYEAATGLPVPYEIAPARPGDIARCYADPGRAKQQLGWEARLTLADMCRDAARFETQALEPSAHDANASARRGAPVASP